MRAQAVAGCLLGLSCWAVWGQNAVQPGPVPLQAELIKRVHVGNVAKGSTIFARVTVDWSGPGCVLRRGAIVEGEVEAAERRKGHAASSLALSFQRAQCNGSAMTQLSLSLVAVAEAPSAVEAVPGVQFTTASVSFGSGIVSNGGVTDMNLPRLQLATEAHRFPPRQNLKSGDVVGIRGLKLVVGVGMNHSSVLTSAHNDVSLNTFTQLLLIPESEMMQRARASVAGISAAGASATASASPVPEPVSRPSEPVNNLEACAPPACRVDLPVTPQELEGHSAGSIAVRPLGYSPRLQRVLDEFDEDQALAWLGGDKLLFSFNAHRLIQRQPGREQTARVVRAVLLDTETKQVIRSVEWQIRDNGQFLWQLDASRILVHAGDELRVYGEDLELRRSIRLSGPLAFARISPNGELIAVATLRERHSAELHARLREELKAEPEEDVDVRLLDQTFNVIASTSTVSNIMPPTLLNQGQVILLSQPGQAYRLALNRWDKTSGTLARFESQCTPRQFSIAPDLLFLLSCDLGSDGEAFRVVRNDGKLMLRGRAGPMQAGLDAEGNGSAFAVKVVTADRDLARGASFTADNLESEELRVYRAADGKRLLSVRVDGPPTSRNSFALSADGSHLAVLSGTEIKIFLVPGN